MYNNQKESDWELRKRLRLEQVRQQSKEFAHELRKKVSNEQKLKLKEIERTKDAEHKNWQRKTLNVINQEYIECLKNIGSSHANALLAKSGATEDKKEKLTNFDNICFLPQTSEYGKPEKLLPAVTESSKRAVNFVAKPKQPSSLKVKPKVVKKKLKSQEKQRNKDKNTQTEHVVAKDLINLERSNIGISEAAPSISQNTEIDNKENENVPDYRSNPYFSEISHLLKKRSQDTNEDKLSGNESKPHFYQISNLLKKAGASQENNKNEPLLNNKPHFSQVSNLIKQRRAGQPCIATTTGTQLKESAETDVLKRRPSVVSFKSTNDGFTVPYSPNEEMSHQPMIFNERQINEHSINNQSPQRTLNNKVQMYDNRTKFAKEYIPQQSLTQRTSSTRESPNAMELAKQDNERMRLYLNVVDERLKKDHERGENAIERKKLIRKHKSLINELDKLSTEEKLLKSYIHSHQPPQYEPKMQNMRDFIEKRTIITTSEVKKQNTNYINVASIKSTSSESRSEDSRKSIVLDYEESLVLENLSETNVNVDTINRFANNASPMITGKSEKLNEIQANINDEIIQTINVPKVNSNGKNVFDTPIKITIQIQQGSEKQQPPAIITPNESNFKLSQLESNSSSLTEYRSLPKTFTGSSRPPTEQILTDISKPSAKYNDLHQTHKQIMKEAELECYIRRLLQMSKESVDELPNITDNSSIRESIINTTSNANESKYLEVENLKPSNKPVQFESRCWDKENQVDFSDFSKSSTSLLETSSISTRSIPKISIQKATSYSNLSDSSHNKADISNQYKTYNQRIIELTDLMTKVRIERQQILERTSLSSDTANVPNNSTEYHELPSRLLLVQQKLPLRLEKADENKMYHELSTIMETGQTITPSILEKSSTMNVDKIINEVFTQSSSDPKIEVVPYQNDEKLEETINRSDSQESILDVYAELKRRNILPNMLKNLVQSNYQNQSPNVDEVESSIATESLFSISSSINFNRRSLLAHSISVNGNSSSTGSSSLSQPALNLKEFLQRELMNKSSSSDSVASSKQRDDKGHRTSTPVTKQSSSKSLYLSIDAQSNLFSGESQISSVKSNTTTSNWDSA